MESPFLLAALGAALSTVAPAKQGGDDATVPPVPPTPKVVIGEIGFDPSGPDAGQEWIELAVTGGPGPFTISGFTLESASAGQLYKFGLSTVAPGDTVLVSLGPVRPDLANLDLSAGRSRILFSGPTVAERLDDQSEVIVLRDSLGTIRDAVVFGTDGSALATPLGAEVAAAGAWPAGAFVDVGFGAATAHEPGNSVGRNRYADDTNSLADWAGNGGPDGVGGSPGGPNNCDVTNVDSLLLAAQLLVNECFAVFAPHPAEMLRFHVTDGTVGTVVTQPIDANRYRVTAEHQFTVDDTLQGTGPVAWSGTLVHEFEQFAPRAYRIHIAGTIASDAGDELAVDYSVARSGYATSTLHNDLELDAQLQLYGSKYPFHSTNATTSQRTGENQVLFRSERSQTTWATGKASLDIVCQVARTLVSDTELAYAFEVTGTPFGESAALLGQSLPPTGSKMAFKGSGTVTCSSVDDFVSRWNSAEMSIDGTVVSRTIASDPLVVTSSRTGGAWGDLTGQFEALAEAPIYAPNGTTLVTRAETTMSILQRIASSKLIVESASEHRVDGTVVAQGRGVADPPLQTYTPPADVVFVHQAYGHTGPHGLSGTARFVQQAGSLAVTVTCGLGVATAWTTGIALGIETGGASLLVTKCCAAGTAALCYGIGALWNSLF